MLSTFLLTVGLRRRLLHEALPKSMIKQTLIPILLLSPCVAAAAAIAAGPPPDHKVSHELLELRGSLVSDNVESVLANVPHYRPLCDADGYPLVGNVLPKVDPETGITTNPTVQPSQFCTQVRSSLRKA